MKTKENTIKYLTIYCTYLLLVWGFYRINFFKLPVEIEETILKPILWLVPLFVILKKENKGLSSLGLTMKNIFPSIYFVLILGVFFAIEGILLNFIKYEGLDFSSYIGEGAFVAVLSLSLVTAITEEISFRGYVFGRLLDVSKNQWLSNGISTLIWGLIHLPISIFWWKLSLVETSAYMLLIMIFGAGSAFVYSRTKNIASSIILHMLWEWPILLFR